MDGKKFHIIYRTTRVTDGKFYIGMHSTDDLGDGYLGSGLRISRSVRRYGPEIHEREILEYAQTREQLATLEKQYVNEEVLKDPKCMNLKLGGNGGGLPVIPEHVRAKMSYSHLNLSKEKRERISNGSRNRPNACYEKMVQTRTVSGTGVRSIATRQKISIASTGKSKSPEHLANLARSRGERTEEQRLNTRKKIVASLASIIWTLLLEDHSETIEVRNLKQWCALRNLNVTGVMRTFKSNKPYRGVQVISKAKVT